MASAETFAEKCEQVEMDINLDPTVPPIARQEMEETTSVLVSITDLIEYFGVAKRPIKMGEEIVNARRVLTVGFEPGGKYILGLVVRTTSLTELPHEVKLTNLNLDVAQWVGVCSCKAGAGQKCKHIASVLIFLNK